MSTLTMTVSATEGILSGKRRDTMDHNFALPFIHYSHPEAYVTRTVYGKKRDGLFYNYDDRIYSEDARRAANASGAKPRTIGWWTAYLNAFHGVTDVQIEHVESACNRSSGYQWLVFGYTYSRKGETR